MKIWKPTRRAFLRAGALLGLGTLGGRSSAWADWVSRRPVVIASGNGLRATARCMELLNAGSEALDAVVAGVKIVEGDPEETSVGYGGLPNAAGEVELDAAVMDGATWSAGAVGALRGFRDASSVALAVMRFTEHVLLVGDGARRFALERGFREEDLLTDRARDEWSRWRAASGEDGRAAPVDSLEGGTIHCAVLDPGGDLAGVTSTSGAAFKVPGRVGDSPLIGAGLYVDNDVGVAGSTGLGEPVIKVCGSMQVVEGMRRGLSPTDACLAALRRIVQRNGGEPDFQVTFYALSKRGEYGAASIWSGPAFAVSDSAGNRLETGAYLLERG